jgi:hypothetical protein
MTDISQSESASAVTPISPTRPAADNQFRFRGRIAAIEQNALAYHNALVAGGLETEARPIRNYFDPNIPGSKLNDLTKALTNAMFKAADRGDSRLFEIGLSIYDPSFELPPNCQGVLPHPHNQWGFEPLGLLCLDGVKTYTGPRGWTLPTQPTSETLGCLLIEGHYNVAHTEMTLRMIFEKNPSIALWTVTTADYGQPVLEAIEEATKIMSDLPAAERRYHELSASQA